MDDSGDEQSGRAGERSPGLKSHREPEPAEGLAYQPRVAFGLGRMFCPVSDAPTAAEIDAADGKPQRPQFENEVGDPCKGEAIRLEFNELRADMDRETNRLDARKLSGKAIGGDRRTEIDPKFIRFHAGRDLG